MNKKELGLNDIIQMLVDESDGEVVGMELSREGADKLIDQLIAIIILTKKTTRIALDGLALGDVEIATEALSDMYNCIVRRLSSAILDNVKLIADKRQTTMGEERDDRDR